MKLNISCSGFETRAVGPGVVPFLSSDINSPVVQKVIDYVAQVTGVPRSAVESQIESEIASKMKDFSKSELLFGTIAQNIGENVAFSMMENIGKEHFDSFDIDFLFSSKEEKKKARQDLFIKNFERPILVVEGAPKFSPLVLAALVKAIRSEHKEFQTFAGFIRQKSVWNPTTEYVEDLVEITADGIKEQTRGIRRIETAAADPNGRFFYCKRFMQNLINFAYLKGLKPQGKKYVSNGGSIPDEYAYAEFIIIHEFKHYTMDDFFYQGVIPNANSTIINYVGDFRTNYDLVKAGYEQLPIGLFNDQINLDRCPPYENMYKTVKEELERIKEDNEEDGEDGEDGEGGGKGGGQKGKGKSAKKVLDKESNDSHDIGQEKGKEILDKDKQNGKTPSKTMDDINNHNEQNKGIEEANTVEPNPDYKKQDKGAINDGGAKGSLERMEITKEAKYSWQEILKRMINQACKVNWIDVYYKKNPRDIAGSLTSVLTGRGIVKPAEVDEENPDPKICFVIDASGSMANELELLYANVLNLFKKYPMHAYRPFLLFKVVGEYDLYHCVFSTKKATHINVHTGAKTDHPLQEVFTKAGGAENFDKKLADHVIEVMKLGYNVVLISDMNITDDNFDQINRMRATNKKQMFIIFGSKEDYERYRDRLGGAHENISHM